MQRAALIDHLTRLYCGGAIDQVVIRRDLSATAATTDRLLMLDAVSPELGELPQDVGVIDLGLLITSLKSSGSDEVVLDISDNNRLVIARGHGDFEHLLCDPSYVTTRVAEEQREAVLDYVGPAEAGIRLGRDVLDWFATDLRVLGPEEVVVEVDGKGDLVGFRFGSDTVHRSFVRLPGRESVPAAGAFSHTAAYLQAIFRQPGAEEGLFDVKSDGAATVRIGGYLYISAPTHG